ncbi:Type II toxin-antitoxin system VapC family toxin [Sulfidibacter corallicola]|uniref:Type II toxin-antitoxin system VapC family toxin n=1 Tax=Sulfidibacter corallicola TaxID=2818388 RepID=A0A8A4U5B7_SULCO|nr:type II toxin-antitoxin system VapC family toxin [Sulfidibacter corallicola]QTD53935.1 type II toxin-antitoxin system VapC family toxin [Sulfidibacter corallicola]
MTRLIMLDTNTCSFIMRKRPPTILETMTRYVLEGNLLVISAITYLELRYGAIGKKASPKHNLLVTEFVDRIDEVVGFDREAVESTARLKKHLSDRGTPICPNDTLIAGHALAIDAVLVTDNLAEFGRVPDLELENWKTGSQ